MHIKQVLITGCKDFVLEVENLINFVELFESHDVSVTVVGYFGVQSFKTEKSGNVRLKFRDDSDPITFIDQFSTGCIEAASFPKGEHLTKFEELNNRFRFPSESSRTRWSQRSGWHSKKLTNRMRASLS